MYKKILKHIFLIIIFSSVFLPSFGITLNEEISKIETVILNMTFEKDTTKKRLERLEKSVYGIVSSKDTNIKRIEKLKNDLGIETVVKNPAVNTNENNKSVQETQNQYNKNRNIKDDANYPAVDRLEEIVLNTTYKDDSIYSRLERLEMKIFNTRNQTSSLQDRVNALNSMVFNNGKTNITQAEDVITLYDNNKVNNEDFALSMLEQQILKKSYSGQSVDTRLSRLEQQMFNKNFNYEDRNTRIERLTSVVQAQTTSKNYENNKIKQFFSTGMQIGSILLMILAMIL